ncbi:exoglucanase 3 [Coprinopsis cinerea okayama7|uniref:Glucanase n=2 Tax=Coprinopsis cinerea TaxID=5346 RepID=A8NW81_COPC7|nr:exoglucanase 3 [Coprinopsis cinerea okayama7\|eukprot:XP_001836853.1 exoglucanase 3 [Coprinopsis cinerea okayama7\
MKYLNLLAALLAVAPLSLAAPSIEARQSNVNPYIGKSPLVIRSYAQKLEETVRTFQQRGDQLNAARTRTVQNVATFAWISDTNGIGAIRPLIQDALAQQARTGQKVIVQIVVYNLPDRDCSANASTGEFTVGNDGLNRYKNFVNTIARELSTADADKLHFALLLEPDALANLVTNANAPRCRIAAPAYKEGIAYTLATLSKPNVDVYIDAANGGWLGWNDNLRPSAELFKEVYDLARRINPNAKVRGLAVNVSNYNQYRAEVREPFTEWNDAWDESRYVNVLTPHLNAVGFPAHFIVDQGRGGKGGIRTEWGQWCNVRNAGFGIRPTADQGVLQNPNVDAIVWVKPGGESDGTSDLNSNRYDPTCRSPVAHVPAPEAGQWFNEYVVNLVLNANPPLEPTW